jgi:hypothetical protein
MTPHCRHLLGTWSEVVLAAPRRLGALVPAPVLLKDWIGLAKAIEILDLGIHGIRHTALTDSIRRRVSTSSAECEGTMTQNLCPMPIRCTPAGWRLSPSRRQEQHRRHCTSETETTDLDKARHVCQRASDARRPRYCRSRSRATSERRATGIKGFSRSGLGLLRSNGRTMACSSPRL